LCERHRTRREWSKSTDQAFEANVTGSNLFPFAGGGVSIRSRDSKATFGGRGGAQGPDQGGPEEAEVRDKETLVSFLGLRKKNEEKVPVQG